MSNAHINTVMTVMQLERASRLKDEREVKAKNAYRLASNRSALEAIAAELADCDSRLDDLAKAHAKYY